MLSGTEELDWIRGLQILSLDFVGALYAELGVGVSREKELKGLVRDVLAGRLSEHGQPFCLDEWSDPASVRSAWIDPFLSATKRLLGPEAAWNLTHWVKYVSCLDEERNPWLLYEDLLSSWASSFGKTGVDRIGLSLDRALLAQDLKAAANVTRQKDILDKQAVQPHSEWDLPLFNRLGLQEISQGSDFFPFVDAIILSIAMNRFQHLWRLMRASVTAEDVENIRQAALALSEKKGIVFCDPDELELPR